MRAAGASWGQQPPEEQRRRQRQASEPGKGRAPTGLCDQPPGDRHPDQKSAGPSELGDGDHQPAAAVIDPIAEIRLHGRVEKDLPGGRDQQGGEERRISRPGGHQCHAGGVQAQGQQHRRPTAARIRYRSEEGGQQPQAGAGRHGQRDRLHLDPQAAGDRRQERIDHAEAGVDHRSYDGECSHLQGEAIGGRARHAGSGAAAPQPAVEHPTRQQPASEKAYGEQGEEEAAYRQRA